MDITLIILIILLLLSTASLILFGYSVFIMIYINCPFIGTPIKHLEKLIPFLKTKGKFTLADLGCGSGKALIYLAKQFPDSTFIGYEINFLLVFLGNILIKIFKIKNLKLYSKNFLIEDLSKINIVYVYLFPEINEKVIKHLKTHKRNYDLISYTFPIKNIELIKEITIKKNKPKPKFLIYKI